MKKADAGRHQPFSYSYEEENKLRCLGYTDNWGISVYP